MWQALVEDPTWILVCGIAIEAILAVVLVRTGRGAVVFLMIAAFALVLAGIGIERAIVTPREEVEETLDGLAAALLAGDVNGVVAFIAPDASSLRAEAAAQLPQVKVNEARIRDLKVSLNVHANPPTAVADFRGILKVKDSREQFPYENYLGRFKVDLRRDGDAWLITGYEARSATEPGPGKKVGEIAF